MAKGKGRRGRTDLEVGLSAGVLEKGYEVDELGKALAVHSVRVEEGGCRGVGADLRAPCRSSLSWACR